MTVVNGDADELTEAIGNTESKGSVRCNPLRTYDGFARSVLGVSDTIAKPEAPRVDGDRLYWLHFQVEYKGTQHLGRLRLAYSSYSRNPNVVSGLLCARSTTKVIQLNSDDRDHAHKPLM